MQETQETQVLSLGREDSPGEGNGNPLQYSSLDRGAWQPTVHGVTNKILSHNSVVTQVKIVHPISSTMEAASFTFSLCWGQGAEFLEP